MSTWPIRRKLLFGLALLLVLVGTLAVSGFRGVYAYRSLVRSLSARSTELPKAAAVSSLVSDVRMTIGEIHGYLQASRLGTPSPAVLAGFEARFAAQLRDVHRALSEYRDQLSGNRETDGKISDSSREWQTVQKIESRLTAIARAASKPDWTAGDTVTRMTLDVAQLDSLVAELPSFFHDDIHNLYHEVRAEYRTWIVLEWVTVILGSIFAVTAR